MRRVETPAVSTLGGPVLRVQWFDDYRPVGRGLFPFRAGTELPGNQSVSQQICFLQVSREKPTSVDELLIPYVPEANLLFLADLLSKEADGSLRTLNREGLRAIQILRQLGRPLDVIALAHGGTFSPSEIPLAH